MGCGATTGPFRRALRGPRSRRAAGGGQYTNLRCATQGAPDAPSIEVSNRKFFCRFILRLFTSCDHSHVSAECHRCYEWSFLLSEEPAHPGQSVQEYAAHFLAAEVSTRKRKRANPAAQQSRQFDSSVANASIIREDNPTPCSYDFEPFLVSRIRRKVIIVDFNPQPRLAEGGGEDSFSQSSVKEKGDVFRRLRQVRSGSLLRCRTVRGRSRQRADQWIPQPYNGLQSQPSVSPFPRAQACRMQRRDR